MKQHQSAVSVIICEPSVLEICDHVHMDGETLHSRVYYPDSDWYHCISTDIKLSRSNHNWCS